MDINVKDETTGATPLHLAASRTHWNALVCLVGWGATLNSVDKYGNTPLQIIITGSKSSVIPESPQLNQVSVIIESFAHFRLHTHYNIP